MNIPDPSEVSQTPHDDSDPRLSASPQSFHYKKDRQPIKQILDQFNMIHQSNVTERDVNKLADRFKEMSEEEKDSLEALREIMEKQRGENGRLSLGPYARKLIYIIKRYAGWL